VILLVLPGGTYSTETQKNHNYLFFKGFLQKPANIVTVMQS